MTESWIELAVALIALIAGVLIGTIGIGGVLVVPALTDLMAVPAANAIALSMFGFLLTGLVSVFWRRDRLQVDQRVMWALTGYALVGAGGATLLLDLLPPSTIRLFVAAALLISGIHGLVPATRDRDGPPSLSPAALAGIGIGVGAGSALSGTGGPVMMLPILMMLHFPIRTAIAMAQIIQVPIALSATAVNLHAGRIDWSPALTVGAPLVVGTVAGITLGAYIAGATLKTVIAVGLIALGLWYGATAY